MKGNTVPAKTTLKDSEPTPFLSPTKGQISKLIRAIGGSTKEVLIVRLLEKLYLDREAVQRLLGRSNRIIPALAKDHLLIEVFEILSFPYDFADEEVSSDFGYISGYIATPTLRQNIVDLERELAILQTNFPELADSDLNRNYLNRICCGEIALPYGAERWVLRPNWEKLASEYGLAVEKVFEVLGKVRNHYEGKFGSDYLHETEKKIAIIEVIKQEQNADILIIPVQLGFRHRGRSARRARAVMKTTEFSLGVYEVIVLSLTHPERLRDLYDLWIDCVGDELSFAADGVYDRVIFIRFADGAFEVFSHNVSVANGLHSSASGFLL